MIPHTKLDLKDTLERRRRNAPRQPSADPKPLNKTHLRLLEFIHLFGGFSTIELIHEYARLQGITIQSKSTYIAKELTNVMFHDNGVLEKPEEQFNVKNPYSNMKMNHGVPLVFKVSSKGEKVLKETGLFNKYAPKAHGWYKHQMMTACLYQMFYINAFRAGIPFTPQHELKPKEKYIALPPKVKVFPDAVFVLHLTQPFLIFFELDRGTERGSKKATRKTWGKSIEYYKEILGRKLYKHNLDLPNGHLSFLATITVDNNMEKKILGHINAEYPKGFARMLVSTTRAFGSIATDFYPPKLFDILATPWNRSGYPGVTFHKQ
jgi:hypothetical protein